MLQLKTIGGSRYGQTGRRAVTPNDQK